MKIKSLKNIDINALGAVAKELASQLVEGDVITLSGDLGSGKTTFTTLLMKYLSTKNIEVTSPTFNIVNVYNADKCEVWHFDLYRLESPQELQSIGIDEALTRAISIVEWPAIANEYLPAKRIDINISFASDETRDLEIHNNISRIEL